MPTKTRFVGLASYQPFSTVTGAKLAPFILTMFCCATIAVAEKGEVKMLKHFEEIRTKGKKANMHCDMCGRDIEPNQQYFRTLYSNRGTVTGVRKEHCHPDECFLLDEEEIHAMYEESYVFAAVAVEETVQVPLVISTKLVAKEVVAIAINGSTFTETVLVPETVIEPMSEQHQPWSGHVDDGYPDEIPF